MEDSFTTIAVFQYSSEALIIKGKLESENIRVFLADEYTVDTDPLVSNAIGGVKLQVITAEVAVAKSIIRNIDPSLLKEEIVCSKCGSTNFNLKLTFKNIFLKLIPVNGYFEYKCSDCNTNFKAKEIV
jgi:DNA-directed RNA polymerase subunit RPC12/RpoP